MENAVRRFTIMATLIALLCYVLAFILKGLFFKQNNFLEVYFLIPFILIITCGFHLLLVKASKSNPMLFVNKYLAFSGIKLMVYILFIMIYIIFIKFEIIIFLLSFVILYFIFTIMEVSSLLKFFKKS